MADFLIIYKTLSVLEAYGLGNSINTIIHTDRLTGETRVYPQHFGAKFLEKVWRAVVPEGKSTALPNPDKNPVALCPSPVFIWTK